MMARGETRRHDRHAARYRAEREWEDRQLQILAARLRVTTDGKLGKETPAWVKDLADTPLPAPPPGQVDKQLQILAARLRVTTDRKLGNETPAWVKALASAAPDRR